MRKMVHIAKQELKSVFSFEYESQEKNPNLKHSPTKGLPIKYYYLQAVVTLLV